MTLPNPLCWLRTAWSTLRRFLVTGEAIPVLGHRYRETYSGIAHVSVLECEECGDVTVGWSRLSPVQAANEEGR